MVKLAKIVRFIICTGLVVYFEHLFLCFLHGRSALICVSLYSLVASQYLAVYKLSAKKSVTNVIVQSGVPITTFPVKIVLIIITFHALVYQI